MPPEAQRVIEDVSAEWVVKHGQAWNEADAEGLAFVKELKRSIIELSAEEQAAWTARVAPLLTAYAAGADEKGLPGAAFLEALKKQVAEARAVSEK